MLIKMWRQADEKERKKKQIQHSFFTPNTRTLSNSSVMHKKGNDNVFNYVIINIHEPFFLLKRRKGAESRDRERDRRKIKTIEYAGKFHKMKRKSIL